MDAPNTSDDTLRTLLIELARSEERGPVNRVVLNGCRVLRYFADRSVVTREDAGRWALEHGRPSDHDLIEGALAWETGADKRPDIDNTAAYLFGARAEVIAKGGADPAGE